MLANASSLLLSLPAEIRLRIYEYALAPTGVLTLTSSNTKRTTTVPVIAPQLLATCRQIYNEASDILYLENEVVIAVDAHDTCYPLLPEKRLPSRVVARFRAVCLVLECTAFFSATYDDVDFSPFEAFRSLSRLRLAIIRDQGRNSIPASSLEHRVQLLTHLLSRFPSQIRVGCHLAAGGQQQSFVDDMIVTRRLGRADPENVIQVSGDDIAIALALAREELPEQGRHILYSEAV